MLGFHLSHRGIVRLAQQVLYLMTLAIILQGCTLLPGMSLESGSVIPGDQGNLPSSWPLPLKETIIFYTGPEDPIPGSEGVLLKQSGNLSYISGFWYQVDPVTCNSVRIMAGTSENDIKRTIQLAHSLGVGVELVFHNLLYGAGSISQSVINRLMAEPELASKLADQLVQLVQRFQFDGVNIDVEYVIPTSRRAFTEFVKVVADRLHQDNIRVNISVPAKTWDDPANGWAGGYDYAALGALVDRMMLMTYDEHGYSSSAGPIASSGWVRRVVQYAVQQVPAQKLLIGLAGYGFDWVSGKRAPIYLDYKMAMAPVLDKRATLQWDATANAPHYTYTDISGSVHNVWFENASSSTWKLDLIKEFDLGGFALWRGGMEDPVLWNVVSQKIRARK